MCFPKTKGKNVLITSQEPIRSTQVRYLLCDFAILQRSTLHAVLMECQNAVGQTHCTREEKASSI